MRSTSGASPSSWMWSTTIPAKGSRGRWKRVLAAKCYSFMCSSLTRVYRPTPDGRYFSNATGTGNDLDFSGDDERYTKRLVRDLLALWHQKYGFDGFRFDLARIWPTALKAQLTGSTMTRASRRRTFTPSPGIWAGSGGSLWTIMAGAMSIIAGAKWVGQYRDQIRRFSQSALRSRSAFKRLIEGYGQNEAGSPASTKPWRSVNFVAVHDGYTLRDCTFFNDVGGSHNCWDSDGGENLRRERSKLLMGILLTSQGVPLVFQGDEFGAH